MVLKEFGAMEWTCRPSSMIRRMTDCDQLLVTLDWSSSTDRLSRHTLSWHAKLSLVTKTANR